MPTSPTATTKEEVATSTKRRAPVRAGETERAEPSGGASGPRRPTGVYRREGTVWRISESVEGGLRVEVLIDGAWVMGPVNLVGLRLDSSTKRLSQAAIDQLPK